MVARYRSSSYSQNRVLGALGSSRQALAQHRNRRAIESDRFAMLEAEVARIRAVHPGCGLEKLYRQLQPDFVGRDRFIAHFQARGYGLSRKRKGMRTTYSQRVRVHPNLANGMELTGVNELWQSDITYFLAGSRYYYLTFILDVYSRKIVGYSVSDHMRASANCQALRMAYRNRSGTDLSKLVHHSDRGSQYVSKEYEAELQRGKITRLSMCQLAQENAYSERINGTIKGEYLQHWRPKTFTDLKKMVRVAVNHYNQKRPHRNLPGQVSPDQFESRLKRKANHSPKLVVKPYLSEQSAANWST